MMTVFAAPERRFSVELASLERSAGPSVELPVFARSPSAAARIAQQVFPRGHERVRAVRSGTYVMWEPPDHGPASSDE